MLLSIFSIYDTGISTWLCPLFFRNKGEAMRWWQETVNNPESKLAKHPSDYTLFHVGVWDDDKCSFDLLKTPVSLGKAIEFVKSGASSDSARVMKEGNLPDDFRPVS